MTLDPCDPLAIAVTEAIQKGDLDRLERLLDENPGIASARIGPRTLLHVATDWPGHFPNNPATVARLIDHGADANAHFTGRPHSETPLHWAASCDDVAALDVLLDRGADIEAMGSIIGGLTALADAVAFAQWNCARRLVERGAGVNLWQAAALGLMDRVEEHFAAGAALDPMQVTNALWSACHGGQRATAEYLLDRGADINWIGHDKCTPLDAAVRSGAAELAQWLRSRGARSAGW
jgi:ankyrin repeat protein